MFDATIYTLSDPRCGAVRYVGKTVSEYDRKRSHLYGVYIKGNPKSEWVKELKTIGLRPIMEALEKFQYSEDVEWQIAERFWISTLRFYGFNLLNCDGGGNSGKKISEATRLKIKKSCTERMTPEEKENLRSKLIGRKMHTEEFKQHLSNLKSGVARPDYVTDARESGRVKWRERMGRRTTRFCVLCKGVIKYNVLKDGTRVPDLHFFTEGIGYAHTKCKKIILSQQQ